MSLMDGRRVTQGALGALLAAAILLFAVTADRGLAKAPKSYYLAHGQEGETKLVVGIKIRGRTVAQVFNGVRNLSCTTSNNRGYFTLFDGSLDKNDRFKLTYDRKTKNNTTHFVFSGRLRDNDTTRGFSKVRFQTRDESCRTPKITWKGKKVSQQRWRKAKKRSSDS